MTDEQVAAVVHMTLHERLGEGTPWTVRSLAQVTGVSKDRVHRIWRTFGLPHRQQHFKRSTDAFFLERVRDIVGPDLHPPSMVPRTAEAR